MSPVCLEDFQRPLSFAPIYKQLHKIFLRVQGWMRSLTKCYYYYYYLKLFENGSPSAIKPPQKN